MPSGRPLRSNPRLPLNIARLPAEEGAVQQIGCSGVACGRRTNQDLIKTVPVNVAGGGKSIAKRVTTGFPNQSPSNVGRICVWVHKRNQGQLELAGWQCIRRKSSRLHHESCLSLERRSKRRHSPLFWPDQRTRSPNQLSLRTVIA